MEHTIDFAALRADKNLLIQALQDAGAVFDSQEKTYKCPFHDDRTPSAEVKQSEDGGWRCKCFAASCGFGGDVLDVRAKASGKNRNDVLAELRASGNAARRDSEVRNKAAHEKARDYPTLQAAQEAASFCRNGRGKIVETYLYTDPVTKAADLIVFRIQLDDGSKEFKCCHPRSGRFVLSKPSGLQPLYNRTRLISTTTVVVVEGEKCVHALQKIGIVATTSPGGSKNGSHADWSPLAGKTVIVWPDRDKPDKKTAQRSGIEYGKAVVAQLEVLNPAPKILWLDCDQIADVPEDGGDVADLLDSMAGIAEDEKPRQIQLILQDARPVGSVSDLRDHFELIIQGKLLAIPWPWARLHSLTQALLPGSFTLLCGSPGASKSLMLLQALQWWFDNGYKAACLMLEDTKLYHLCRALSQRAQYAGLTNMAWVVKNPDRVREAQALNTLWLEGFARSIFEPPVKAAPANPGREFIPAYTAEDAIVFMRTQAMQGREIICIDPVSYLEIGDRPWIADMKILQEGKNIAREFNTRIVAVTHPRKHAPFEVDEVALDDMGGWGGMGKFSHTSLWLHWHEEKEDLIATSQGTVSMCYDRTLAIKKARNSSGRGVKLAFKFKPESLTLEELGVVVAEEE